MLKKRRILPVVFFNFKLLFDPCSGSLNKNLFLKNFGNYCFIFVICDFVLSKDLNFEFYF